MSHLSRQDVENSIVRVTTVRYEKPGGEPSHERTASAIGPFEQAIAQALSERLAEWARPQVCQQVLQHAPAPGQRVEYEGLYNGELRHLIITAEHAWPDGTPAGDAETHIDLPDLELPARAAAALAA